MRLRQRQRLALVILAVLLIGGATGLVLAALQDKVAFFVTPSQVAERSPSVTTAAVPGAPGEPGSITITVTVPLPAAPAPLLVHPDLGPLEEQLALAARSLQSAIEAGGGR